MYVEPDQSHGTTVQWALDSAEQINQNLIPSPVNSHLDTQIIVFTLTVGQWVNTGPEAFHWMYVETDQSHGTTVQWAHDPAEQVDSTS